MKVPAKLESEWRKRLAKSGFQDLESSDRDGNLSNRGKLHDENNDHEALAVRIEHGEAWTEWAQGVLQTMTGKGPAAVERRRIWGRYVGGESIRKIAADLGVSFHKVHAIVSKTEEKYRPCRSTTRTERNLVKRADPGLLATIAAAMLVAAAKTQRGR